MIAALLLLLQAAPTPAPAPTLPPPAFPNPSPEAVALGRRLAEAGTVAALAPMLAAKDTEDLVRENPGLTAAEQAELRRTAAETFAAANAKVMTAMGRAYAERLSPADLARLVAANEDPAARRMRAALPAVIAGTMTGAGAIDLRADVRKAFCAKTGKLCGK